MISIIIPVYNNPIFITRCLDSIISQTCQNYEAIVIDDGSTDNTYDICKMYSSKYKQIKIYKKENGGVSSARNLGIKKANGEYIIFVDSDDYLEKTSIEEITKEIKSNKDVYIYNNILLENNKRIMCSACNQYSTLNHIIYEIIEPYKNKDRTCFLRTIWAKVYKKSIIKDIRFPEDVYIGQDACFSIDVFKKINNINKISFINKSWYIYDRTNIESATHNYKKDMYVVSKTQFDYIIRTISNLQHDDIKYLNTVLCKFCWKIFWILYYQGQIKKNDNCFKWYNYTKKYINNKEIYHFKLDDKLANLFFIIKFIFNNKYTMNFFRRIYIKRYI